MTQNELGEISMVCDDWIRQAVALTEILSEMIASQGSTGAVYKAMSLISFMAFGKNIFANGDSWSQVLEKYSLCIREINSVSVAMITKYVYSWRSQND